MGKTGYPLVDAGMRELWHTGGMHNRVRMVVASFLVKDLLIPWQKGEEWFWDTLVDADLANNAVSWQWVAGCGADAAPYFRIFNPTLQSQKFDPNGVYIRKWIPELRALDSAYIHSPWQVPTDVLEKAGIQLGMNYPFPMVDHGFARKRALAAMKSSSMGL
jgi:deoxyribodipyrimidine photo-lyase